MRRNTMGWKPLALASVAILALTAAPASATGPTFAVDYTGTALSVVSGGQRHASAYSHQLDLGATIGAGEGEAGWSLSMASAWTAGRSLSELAVGDVGGVQATFFGDGVWLTELSVNRATASGRISIGRLAPISAFTNIDAVGSFVNATFGANGGGNPVEDPGPTSSPASSWGAEIKQSLGRHFSVRGGAYLSNHERFTLRKRGMDFSFNPADGVLGVGELGWTSGGGTRLGTGAWVDSAWFMTFTGERKRGNNGFYAYLDQPVGDSSSGARRPSLFVVMQVTTRRDRNQQPLFVIGGLVIPGPIASRPSDEIALGVTVGRFGGDCPRRGWESVVEANYRFALTEKVAVRPDVQYVITPSGDGRNALVAGLQLEFGF